MEYEGWKAGQALRDVRKSRHLTIEQLSERVKQITVTHQSDRTGKPEDECGPFVSVDDGITYGRQHDFGDRTGRRCQPERDR